MNFITSGEFLFLNYGPTELTTITYLDTSYSTFQSVEVTGEMIFNS